MPHEVRVAAGNIRWPDRCACCMGHSDEALVVDGTGEAGRGLTWTVPYCAECLWHVQSAGRIGPLPRWAQLGVGVLFVGIAALAWAYGSWISFGLMTITLALGAAAIQSVWAKRREDAEAAAAKLCQPGCACPGPAVQYRGLDESGHAFAFANLQYAEAFDQANRPKRGASRFTDNDTPVPSSWTSYDQAPRRKRS
jgi:hypothetical protein